MEKRDHRQPLAKRKLLPIFTGKVLDELLTQRHSSRVDTARRTLESLGVIDWHAPTGHVFDRAYSVLLEAYPAEYILLNECLCAQVSGAHPAAAYREQAVAGSKADLSVFWSGHSRGYEIKSRFDRLDRLQTQLQTYQQVFTHTYAVTDQHHAPRVLEDSPAAVGVFSVSSDGIQELRPATERPDLIRLDRLFALLRKHEYLQLIKAEFGAVPELPNTRIYRACLALFQQIDRTRAQALVSEILCKRESRPPLGEDRAWQLPRSLRALALSSQLDQSELLRLSCLLERP